MPIYDDEDADGEVSIPPGWADVIDHGWTGAPSPRRAVHKWVDAGWDSFDALVWTEEYHHGVTAGSAWAHHPHAAKIMCDAGFEHALEATRWCRQTGVGPTRLDVWIEAGVTDPNTIRLLDAAGVSPAEHRHLRQDEVDRLLVLGALVAPPLDDPE